MFALSTRCDGGKLLPACHKLLRARGAAAALLGLPGTRDAGMNEWLRCTLPQTLAAARE
jgi:hypothetical protein